MESMIKNVITCGLVLLLTVGQIESRQIRINRYATEIENDSTNGDIEAKVTRLQPVPNTGFRSERAFNTSGNRNVSTEAALEGQKDVLTTTTSYALDLSMTTVGFDDQVGDSTSKASVDAAKAPYPAAGYRPSRAFLFPTENQVTEGVIGAGGDDFSAISTTTSTINILDYSTSAPDSSTTAAESSETTAAVTDTNPDVTTEQADASIPTPSIASKTPYPPAGYRPSRAFLLPYEIPLQSNPDPTVTKHPVCGVSDFPLRPKPAPGAKEDPDAERVPFATAVGPTIVAASVPSVMPLNARPLLEVRTQRLVAQPIFIARRRPLEYSPPVSNW